MHDPGHRAVPVFIQGILGLRRVSEMFPPVRHNGPSKGMRRVLPVQQGGIIRSDGQRQGGRRPTEGLDFVRREVQHPSQKLGVLDPVSQLPVPIVPIGQSGLGEILLPKGVGSSTHRKSRSIVQDLDLGRVRLVGRGGYIWNGLKRVLDRLNGGNPKGLTGPTGRFGILLRGFRFFVDADIFFHHCSPEFYSEVHRSNNKQGYPRLRGKRAAAPRDAATPPPDPIIP